MPVWRKETRLGRKTDDQATKFKEKIPNQATRFDTKLNNQETGLKENIRAKLNQLQLRIRNDRLHDQLKSNEKDKDEIPFCS